ncbi:MAG: sigma-70 family RNA polymerase sigma factor [Bacteroidota bacterium]
MPNRTPDCSPPPPPSRTGVGPYTEPQLRLHLADVYDRYREPLLKYAETLFDTRDIAHTHEDVVHDAYEAAWNRALALASPAPLAYPYLREIVRNRVPALKKRATPVPSFAHLPAEPDAEADRNRSALDRRDFEVLFAAVQREVEALSGHQRTAMEGALADRSHTDVVADSSIASVESARTHLSRARRKIRVGIARFLREHFPSEND